MATLTKIGYGQNVSRDLFYCRVATCSEICSSQDDLERHTNYRHNSESKKRKIEDEFNFDDDEDETDDFDFGDQESEVDSNQNFPVQSFETSKEYSLQEFKEICKTPEVKSLERKEIKDEPRKPTPRIDTRKIEIKRIKSETDSKAEVTNQDLKMKTDESKPEADPKAEVTNQEVQIKAEESKLKIKVNAKTEKVFINKDSIFTLDKVESILGHPLTNFDRIDYDTLISKGRDQEIYFKLFGRFNEKRKWVCKAHHGDNFFGDRNEFESHFKTDDLHKSDDLASLEYSCELCPAKLKAFDIYKTHLENVHFQNAQCKLCDQIFKNNNRLKTHKFKEHSIGGMICDVCTKMCSSKTALLQHKFHYHTGEAVPCPVCAKSFPNKLKLKAHESSVHSQDGLPCSVCAKMYPNKYVLKAHESSVHSDDRFPCSQCPKTFKTLGNCKVHQISHTNEGRGFFCDKCGDSYKSPKTLKIHNFRDHGEQNNVKIYSCGECDKSFFFATDLTTHRRWHKGDPKVTCETCKKVFSKPEAKRVHIKRVHHKIKDKSCHLCSFTTDSKEKLLLHIRKVHENQMEQCLICNIEVKHPYQHYRSSHNPEAWTNYKAAMKEVKRNLKAENEP